MFDKQRGREMATYSSLLMLIHEQGIGEAAVAVFTDYLVAHGFCEPSGYGKPAEITQLKASE